MRLRIILAVAALVFLGGIAWVVIPFFIWPEGRAMGMYKLVDIIEAPSPDGRYIAAGYHVFGSAIVADTTVIEIRPKSEWFLETKDSTVLAVDAGGPLAPFAISWQGDDALTVTYTPGTIENQKTRWRDVRINYLPK